MNDATFSFVLFPHNSETESETLNVAIITDKNQCEVPKNVVNRLEIVEQGGQMLRRCRHAHQLAGQVAHPLPDDSHLHAGVFNEQHNMGVGNGNGNSAHSCWGKIKN